MASSTTSNFSIRCVCRISFASSRLIPGQAVTRLSLVITSETSRSSRFSKRRSRLVKIPTSLSSLMTGNPDIWERSMISCAWAIVVSGVTVMGLIMTPLSCFLTLAISAAWAGIPRLRWITPRPPACAMAMAVRASVTVSIAALTKGVFRRIVRVTWVETSASFGKKSDSPGKRRMSSKVRPSGISTGSIGIFLGS